MSNSFSGIDLQCILSKFATCYVSLLVFAKCPNYDSDIFAHLMYREFWQCLYCVFTKYTFWQL